MVWPDRDEHARTATPGNGRTANRRVHQTSLNGRYRRVATGFVPDLPQRIRERPGVYCPQDGRFSCFSDGNSTNPDTAFAKIEACAGTEVAEKLSELLTRRGLL